MDVVNSAHVLSWHLDLNHQVLIELELVTTDGDGMGMVAAVLSPALAEELGVRLTQVAADVEALSR